MTEKFTARDNGIGNLANNLVGRLCDSKEGQEAVLKGGLSSARKDVASPDQKFKKVYIESKYSPEVMERKFAEWEGLKRRLFISRR